MNHKFNSWTMCKKLNEQLSSQKNIKIIYMVENNEFLIIKN